LQPSDIYTAQITCPHLLLAYDKPENPRHTPLKSSILKVPLPQRDVQKNRNHISVEGGFFSM
jgi:hypothetical protein